MCICYLLIKVLKIKQSELILKLKKDIEPYKSKMKPNRDLDGIEKAVSDYNLENFKDITNYSMTGKDTDVDVNEIKEINRSIDYFFALYLPDDIELRDFIKLISIFLIFIVQKPLHPPGVKFSNDTTVYKKDNSYYCTGKKYFIKDDFSLCKFCPAKSP